MPNENIAPTANTESIAMKLRVREILLREILLIASVVMPVPPALPARSQIFGAITTKSGAIRTP
jgi:hypothetical protein